MIDNIRLLRKNPVYQELVKKQASYDRWDENLAGFATTRSDRHILSFLIIWAITLDNSRQEILENINATAQQIDALVQQIDWPKLTSAIKKDSDLVNPVALMSNDSSTHEKKPAKKTRKKSKNIDDGCKIVYQFEFPSLTARNTAVNYLISNGLSQLASVLEQVSTFNTNPINEGVLLRDEELVVISDVVQKSTWANKLEESYVEPNDRYIETWSADAHMLEATISEDLSAVLIERSESFRSSFNAYFTTVCDYNNYIEELKLKYEAETLYSNQPTTEEMQMIKTLDKSVDPACQKYEAQRGKCVLTVGDAFVIPGLAKREDSIIAIEGHFIKPPNTIGHFEAKDERTMVNTGIYSLFIGAALAGFSAPIMRVSVYLASMSAFNQTCIGVVQRQEVRGEASMPSYGAYPIRLMNIPEFPKHEACMINPHFYLDNAGIAVNFRHEGNHWEQISKKLKGIDSFSDPQEASKHLHFRMHTQNDTDLILAFPESLKPGLTYMDTLLSELIEVSSPKDMMDINKSPIPTQAHPQGFWKAGTTNANLKQEEPMVQETNKMSL